MPKKSEYEKSEFAKIPYIDSKNVGGRVLTTLTFFENRDWEMWFPAPHGLIPIKGEPSEANYFGREQERDTDIYLDFLNFMAQRACWPDTMRFFGGIGNDIHNLGASLGKFELFHRSSGDTGIELRRFASTELEYIFGVCRSLFDLLQEVIVTLYQRFEFLDKDFKKKQLPKSFRKMVIRKEQLRDIDEIRKQFLLPIELAGFYHRQGPFFKVLREYRDKVVHNGKDFNSIFVTEKGFAVNADMEPFASFGVWNEEHMLPNRLASLRPIIAYVIMETFRAYEDFSHTIQKIIQFPPDIVPNFKLFIRGYYNQHLLGMKDVLANCSWWDENT